MVHEVQRLAHVRAWSAKKAAQAGDDSYDDSFDASSGSLAEAAGAVEIVTVIEGSEPREFWANLDGYQVCAWVRVTEDVCLSDNQGGAMAGSPAPPSQLFIHDMCVTLPPLKPRFQRDYRPEAWMGDPELRQHFFRADISKEGLAVAEVR